MPKCRKFVKSDHTGRRVGRSSTLSNAKINETLPPLLRLHLPRRRRRRCRRRRCRRRRRCV